MHQLDDNPRSAVDTWNPNDAHDIERGGLGVHPRAFVVDSDSSADRQPRPWRARTAKQAIPLPVAALLWGAAEAAHLNLDVAPLGIAIAAPAVYLVAAMATWTAWAKRHPDNRAARRRWATTIIATGTGWMLWASLAGPFHLALAALVVGGTATTLPYWTRNSVWKPGRRQPVEIKAVEDLELPEAPELETVSLEPDLDANQLHWLHVVIVNNTGLAGTSLVDPETSDDIEQYTVQLPPGGQKTTQTVLSAIANIAAAYGRSLSDVTALPHPTGVQNKALIRFTKTNQLAAARTYPSPHQALDLTGGNIRTLIGHKADGTEVWWWFYRAGFGTIGGAVFGDTGSGKSFLLRLLIASAAYSSLIVPIVSCPQGGLSFPMWIKNGHWPGASPEEILRQARSLIEAHRNRSKVNRLRGRDIHVPTATEPLIIWWIDEIHLMMTELSPAERKEFYTLLDKIEREGRKSGIRIVASDQNPSVPDTFNDKMSLRSSLISAAGQCVTLRLSSDASSMIPGMKLNPTKIPEKFPDGSSTAGLAVLVGDREMFRVCDIRNSEQLAENAPELTIEPVIANRMGTDYTERHTRQLNENAHIAADLQEDDPDLVAEILRENPELAAALPGALAAREQAKHDALAAEQNQPRYVEMQIGFAPFPSIEAAAVPEPETWTCVDAVRKVLRTGVEAFGEIRAQALNPKSGQYSETAIRNAIAELIELGEAKDGGYKLTHYLGRHVA